MEVLVQGALIDRMVPCPGGCARATESCGDRCRKSLAIETLASAIACSIAAVFCARATIRRLRDRAGLI
jgi:hypothetical protein